MCHVLKMGLICLCVLAIRLCLILRIASGVASFDMALLGVCDLDIYERL